MKALKYIIVLFLFASFLGCEDEYEQPNEFSDVQWYTSLFRGESQGIALENYISFSDLSIGATSHSWSFSDTSGCIFLKGEITNQDTTFYQFVDESAGNTSEEQTVHVLFTKPGLQSIRLRNTFSEYVEFEGNDTIGAVKQGDEWVIDTTFVVDVFDSIQPAFKVFKGDEEILNVPAETMVNLSDTLSWPVYEIEAGEALTFVDMTEIGRPNTRTWRVGGGKPGSSTDSAAVVNFYRLGTFRANIQSRRDDQSLPAGSKVKWIPLNIQVNKSSLPFEVNGVAMETFDEKIRFSVTGEMDPFFGIEEDFTVHVVNSESGFDQNIDVQKAEVSSEDGTVIELTLADPIYNTDEITVSYSGDQIQSLDERVLGAFSDLPVEMYIVDILDDATYGFEAGGDGWQPMWDNASTFEFTTEKAAAGNYSLKIDNIGSGGQAKFHSIDAPFDLPPNKTYWYTYKVWIDPATTVNSVNTWILPDWKQFWQGIGSLPRGEWVTIEQKTAGVPGFEYAGDGTDRRSMIQVPGDGLIYIDDFFMAEKEVRPTN